MKREHLVAQAIADAMLAGSSELDGYIERAARLLGRKHRWLGSMCQRVIREFGASLEQRDRRRLTEWILADHGYRAAWLASRPPRVVRYLLDPPRMSPRRGALAACGLPDLPASGDLAAWLGIEASELDWYADVRSMNPPEGALCHYRYVWVPKRYGMRLMEVPKIRLREIQRKILRGILDPVVVHRAAHGFCRGKSCRTYVEPHVGREVVLRMDLREFFPSIPAPRVHALFSALGYPDGVARMLTALCSNAVPMAIASRGAASWPVAKRLGVPHLPQGAPTSPSLANLCALHLDFRLDALARSMDGNYTRYADDIAISGGETLRRRVGEIAALVANIALEEGFEINHRKTRIMHRSDRQILTGVIVNERQNVPRREADRLKAILTNCIRRGPASQNRDRVRDLKAHLAGRVAHVASLNCARGERLKALFSRIDWSR